MSASDRRSEDRSWWPGRRPATSIGARAAAGPVVVQKYGGSSLASMEQVRRIAKVVARRHVAQGPRVVVVSARGNSTDELLAVADGVGGSRTTRESDQLLATGETASAALMAMALTEQGIPAVSLTGGQAGIRATGKHGEGVITSIDARRVTASLTSGQTVVVAGFQAIDEHDDVITLGRGGSDTTAVALAAVLGAQQCEIYTDVEGVYTADPRAVPNARVVPDIEVGVMCEMAFAGARVLHSRAVELAAMHDVAIYVGDAGSHSCGTIIPRRSDAAMFESQGVVVAITHDVDVARVLVQTTGGGTDLAESVLKLLAQRSVPVDLVARSGPYETEFRMGFTIRRSDLSDIRAPLEERIASAGGSIRIDESVGKLSLIGVGLLNRPMYTARMLSVLSAAGIATSWISTSQLRTSVVIPLNRLAEAVLLLHREFDLAAMERRSEAVASTVA